MATDKPRFPITVEHNVADIIEKYRYEHKIKSTSKAAVELLMKGIDEFYGNSEENSKKHVVNSTESMLLEKFSNLNEVGQLKAIDNIDDLVQSGKYKKNHPAAKDDEKTNVAG